MEVEDTTAMFSKMKLDSERFNKRAYDLISQSSDKSTLLSMDLGYVSWF